MHSTTKFRRARLIAAICVLLMNAVLPALASPDPGEVRYFPPGAISSNSKLDSALGFTLGLDLKSMQELPLYQAKDICDNCLKTRLIWERGYGRPIVIDVDISADGKGIITTKMLAYKGNPPKSTYDSKEDKIVRDLEPAKVSNLRELLAKVNFSKPLSEEKETVLDGDMFVFERVIGGNYALLWHGKVPTHFWQSSQQKSFMDLCGYLTKISAAKELDSTIDSQ